MDARSAPEGPATGRCRSTNLFDFVVRLRGCRVGLRPPRNDVALFDETTPTCHAADGSATVEWRTPDAAGNYPPPPLNGTAHTWHHPLEVLDSTIANGGIALGGVMPGFAAALDEEERMSISIQDSKAIELMEVPPPMRPTL